MANISLRFCCVNGLTQTSVGGGFREKREEKLLECRSNMNIKEFKKLNEIFQRNEKVEVK